MLGVLSLILWSLIIVISIVASYGFAESADIPSILEGCEKSGLAFDIMQIPPNRVVELGMQVQL